MGEISQRAMAEEESELTKSDAPSDEFSLKHRGRSLTLNILFFDPHLKIEPTPGSFGRRIHGDQLSSRQWVVSIVILLISGGFTKLPPVG